MNGIAIRILTVAEAKLPLPDFSKTCATRYKCLAQGGDVFGVEHNLRSLAARGDGPECNAILAPPAANSFHANPTVFETTLESVRERIIKTIGKVTVAREVTSWHPAVARLLKDNDKLSEKALSSSYIASWEKPQFESPGARRKLRILNSLFFATGRFCARPRLERDAERGSISFHREHVCIRLAPSRGKNVDEKLTLSIVAGYGSDRELASWSDGEEGRIEKHLGEIAIEIVYRAEAAYRESVERRFEWRKERKAQLEEERRRQELAAERAERERITRLQKERIEKLLGQAAAFEQARTIRRYVESIRSALAESIEVPADRLDAWATWALAEADRIDPSLKGRFFECFDSPR